MSGLWGGVQGLLVLPWGKWCWDPAEPCRAPRLCPAAPRPEPSAHLLCFLLLSRSREPTHAREAIASEICFNPPVPPGPLLRSHPCPQGAPSWALTCPRHRSWVLGGRSLPVSREDAHKRCCHQGLHLQGPLRVLGRLPWGRGRVCPSALQEPALRARSLRHPPTAGMQGGGNAWAQSGALPRHPTTVPLFLPLLQSLLNRPKASRPPLHWGPS